MRPYAAMMLPNDMKTQAVWTWRGTRQTLVWLVCFLVLAAILQFLHETDWFQSAIEGPAALAVASLTQRLASAIGLQAGRLGTRITTNTGSFEITASCTGVSVFLTYAAAVLPFQTRWRRKLLGLGVGLVGITLLNLLRSVLVVLAASRFPASLWTLHMVVGQALVLAGGTLVFVWWAFHSLSDRPFALSRDYWPALWALLRFGLGYILGYLAYYNLYLTSPLDRWLRGLIVSHVAFLLSAFVPTAAQGLALTAADRCIQLTPACLSSPMAVLFVALVFAWPMRWTNRVLLAGLGFLPATYLYHLFRTFSVVGLAVWARQDSHNFMHVFFGPILIAASVIVCLAAYWRERGAIDSWRRFAVSAAGGAVGSGLTAWLVCAMSEAFVVGWVVEWTGGESGLGRESRTTLALMGPVAVGLWVVLAAITPGQDLRRKVLVALLGAAGLSLAWIALLGTANLLRLDPNLRLLKVLTLAAPLGLYGWSGWWRRPPARGASEQTQESSVSGL